MERRLTEEQVTKAIIRWLVTSGWTIISFDYPQSGTGRALHPNNELSKTDGIFIPDIVAHKNETIVFFENKDRFVLDDFNKVERLRNSNAYSTDIEVLTSLYPHKNIYYGVGMPDKENYIAKTKENIEKVDFIVLAIDKKNARYLYDPLKIFMQTI